MIKYFSNLYTKVGRWMRYDPPSALTGKGWNSFNKEYKASAPIRYYLANTFRRKYILPVIWKYDNIKSWIVYRTYDRYHVVQTGLKPGYYDVSDRMLHSNFNLLRQHVETDLALKMYWNSSDYKKGFIERHFALYRVIFPLKLAHLGMEHLKWEATLDDQSLPVHERSVTQAETAREIIVLYTWWVNIRPARVSVEIHFPSGGDDDIMMGPQIITPAYNDYLKSIEEQEELEKFWNKEDNDMLFRLIKIRENIWS